MNDIVLKPELDGEAHEALPSEHKGLYRKDGESYKFHVPDSSAVAAKNQELLGELKTVKEGTASLRAENEALKAQLAEANNKPPPKDSQELEASWQKKYNDAVEAKDKEISGLKAFAEEQTVGRMATEIAAKLAKPNSEGVILPHVQNRLKAEWIDGRPTAKILDANGAVSASTVDELVAEFRANSGFSPILANPNQSNGGGQGTSPQTGTPDGKSMPFADFKKLSQAARSEFINDGGAIV